MAHGLLNVFDLLLACMLVSLRDKEFSTLHVAYLLCENYTLLQKSGEHLPDSTMVTKAVLSQDSTKAVVLNK